MYCDSKKITIVSKIDKTQMKTSCFLVSIFDDNNIIETDNYNKDCIIKVFRGELNFISYL